MAVSYLVSTWSPAGSWFSATSWVCSPLLTSMDSQLWPDFRGLLFKAGLLTGFYTCPNPVLRSFFGVIVFWLIDALGRQHVQHIDLGIVPQLLLGNKTVASNDHGDWSDILLNGYIKSNWLIFKTARTSSPSESSDVVLGDGDGYTGNIYNIVFDI